MELRHLRYFQEVALQEHMTRAAKRLHITQPSLTRQIRDLEVELGVDLFERLPRGIRLTPAGASFLHDVGALLSGLEEATLRAQRVARGQTGLLRLGIVDPAAWAGAFPKTLTKFRRRFPEVELSVRSLWSVRQMEALESDELDGGVCYGFEPVPESCDQHLIRNDRVVLAAPRSLGWRGRKLGCADLNGEPFVALKRHLAPRYVRVLETECENQGLHPTVVQLVEDENTLLCLVAAGVGLGLVNSAQESRSPGNIDFIPITDFHLDLPLLFVWRSDNLNPSLAQFRGLLG